MKRLNLKEGVKFWLIVSLILTLTVVGTKLYLHRIDQVTRMEMGESYD